MGIHSIRSHLNKNHIASLLSDVRHENKANLDYKAKITIYAYLLCNKLIHSYRSYYYYYHHYYFITSQWCMKHLKYCQ